MDVRAVCEQRERHLLRDDRRRARQRAHVLDERHLTRWTRLQEGTRAINQGRLHTLNRDQWAVLANSAGTRPEDFPLC